MAKKILIEIEAEDLFDKTITETVNECKVYFRVLGNQSLRLCWEYESGTDGYIRFKCSNEISVPEFITINGEKTDKFQGSFIDALKYIKEHLEEQNEKI